MDKTAQISYESLADCRLCPRDCGVNRRQGAHSGELGFCRVDDSLAIDSIVTHRGEEPILGGTKGVCNVFFSHCNLACCFCQNYQISDNRRPLEPPLSLDKVVGKITAILDQGVNALGFVSPSHMLPQMLATIEAVRDQGYQPTIIYNTGGYDRVDSLRQLEDVVDIYLPDCKYMDEELARRWSLAADYPQVARAALYEMYRQKGNVLHLGDDGLARRGLFVRHLVLPGALENTRRVLEFLAGDLSPKLHLSLMAQYYPNPAVANHPVLGRGLLPEEYHEALAATERLGFTNVWVQDFASADFYQPDFEREEPFQD